MFTEKIKKTLIISSYVLLVVFLFSGGYVLGRTGIGTKNAEEAVPEATVQAVMAAVENNAPAAEYEVRMEDGIISIYECTDSGMTVLASEKISESVFPRDDIEELKRGIRFKNIEKAQQLYENFVS